MKTTEIYPKSLFCIFALLLSLSGCSSESKSEIQARNAVDRAFQAITIGDFDEASRHVEESLRLSETAEGYAMKAMISARRGDFEAAKAELEKGRQIDADNHVLREISSKVQKQLEDSQ